MVCVSDFLWDLAPGSRSVVYHCNEAVKLYRGFNMSECSAFLLETLKNFLIDLFNQGVSVHNICIGYNYYSPTLLNVRIVFIETSLPF